MYNIDLAGPIDIKVFGLPKRVAHFAKICLLSFDIDAIGSIGLSSFKHTIFNEAVQRKRSAFNHLKGKKISHSSCNS